MTATTSDLTSLGALCDQIEATHHAYLRRALPLLLEQTQRVAAVHGSRDARLVELRDTFAAFVDELAAHMQKEERILFPMIRALTEGASPADFHCGSVANPIRVMMMEHDHAGEALARMRTLTDDFKPPAGACETHRALLAGLADLARDMAEHVDQEDVILFPRAIQLELA